MAEESGALSYYFDAGTYVVVVSDAEAGLFDMSAAQTLGLTVRLAKVAITKSETAAIFRELQAGAPSRAFGAAAFAASFDPRLGQVVIDGSVDPAFFGPVISAHPGLVVYRRGQGGGRMSRHNDSQPFWGGAEVKDSSSPTAPFDCTTGFAVKNGSGTKFMTSAGHCWYPNLPSVWAGGGIAMGKVKTRAAFPARDMLLIGDKTYAGRIYIGDSPFDSTNIPVSSAADPLPGYAYCTSGAASFEICATYVNDLHAMFCDPFYGCTNDVIEATPPGEHPLEGDSGAPFYAVNSSHSKAFIRGLFIGFLNGNVYAEKWSKVSATLGVSIVTSL